LQRKDIYRKRMKSLGTATAISSSTNPDSMERYLDDPLVSSGYITGCGGYLKYWADREKSEPRLSRMARDFLSAPASSVGAERAFSAGRLQANHLQHNMSADTFRAKMALGSWASSGSSLLPGHAELTNMIGKNRNKSL
jgi:hypothetical protein